MKTEFRVKLYALMLAIVAISVIWIVGSGDAAQSTLQGAVYGKGLFAQAGQTPTDSEQQPADSRNHSIAYYTKMMADIAYKIHSRYMEDVDPESLIEAGIEGMLSNLDPYSVVLKPKSYESLMESTHGKYEGVGMQIDLRDNRVTIVSPMEGTPAWRMGFKAGDKIMKIDTVSTEGMKTDEAANLMRGPAGTKVKLTISRPGIDYPMEYDVERAVIELNSVRYYGLVEPGIGYVRIDKFAETTTEELEKAIIDMKTNMGVKSLIFDLRSNGGGLLDQAISVANLFLPKDKLVVYTQGKYPTSQRKYFSQEEPLLPEGDLVVLVNGGTASASEIVSGALQDWDRAVIVGNTTFGKGLVQQIFGGQNGEAALKLTTAKYYIPSGRCIQKPERAKKHPEMMSDDEIALEEKETETGEARDVFFTNAGRKVYGGGGVVPDVVVEDELWKPIEYNLVRKNMFSEFAIEYATKHKNTPKDFEVSDEIVNEFRNFIKAKEFDYKTGLELDLEKFEATAKEMEKADLFAGDINQMKDLIEKEKAKDFDASLDYIRQSIKREVLRSEYGERGIYEQITLKEDKQVRQALDLLKDKAKYGTLLKPSKKESDKG
ncbi:MAG: S41 family peptidase [Candidatus Zixiibacteriota bacterium]